MAKAGSLYVIPLKKNPARRKARKKRARTKGIAFVPAREYVLKFYRTKGGAPCYWTGDGFSARRAEAKHFKSRSVARRTVLALFRDRAKSYYSAMVMDA